MFARARSLFAPAAKKAYVVVEMKRDVAGELQKTLAIFNKYAVNISSLESRPNTYHRNGPTMHVDFEGDENDPHIKEMITDLRMHCVDVEVMEPRRVPWFPVNIRDLDSTRDAIDSNDGDTGGLMAPDHPGFHDEVYKERRQRIVSEAAKHRHGTPIPRVDYTEDEVRTWSVIWNKLREAHKKWACAPYLREFVKLEQHAGYAENHIPQLEDISNYLQQQTGFTLKPVPGLLSARDFLNGLAFRVFYSTQYIRHGGNPLYTPEPDVVHELMGHVPLFLDHAFADFSQEIGLASLGASDADILRLSSVYWFTIEFGLMTPQGLNGERKVYGAGILSSFGEMEWSCAEGPSDTVRESGGMARDYPELLRPKVVPFNAFVSATQMYPITTYQPMYFGVESFEELKQKVSVFCDSMVRPFRPQYDAFTQSVRTDKHVLRLKLNSTSKLQIEKQKEYFASLKANFQDHGIASADIPL